MWRDIWICILVWIAMVGILVSGLTIFAPPNVVKTGDSTIIWEGEKFVIYGMEWGGYVDREKFGETYNVYIPVLMYKTEYEGLREDYYNRLRTEVVELAEEQKKIEEAQKEGIRWMH